MSRGYDDDYDDRDDMGDDEGLPPREGNQEAAARRTSTPGIFLIICGVLNLLAALYYVGNTVYIAVQPAAEIARQQEMGQEIAAKLFPQMKEEIEKQAQQQQKPPEAAKAQALAINGGLTVAFLLTGIIPLLAGIRMRSLRSFGLSVTGAILAAIPCLSPASCLCGLGSIFGIWALVVLLNPDVKAAFR
jgi:hypothetical protein